MTYRPGVAAMFFALLSGQALCAANSPPSSVDQGRAIAVRDCGSCHAVGPKGQSRRRGAPAFRELHRAYDVEGLAEALAEGIMVGHPDMPARAYEAADIQAVIAYLKSLEPKVAETKSARR